MAEAVPPTRMNLGVYKGKQVAAKKGYDLLKSKADALKVRFRDICKLIYDTKIGMADLSASSFFSLTQAEYAAGNFRSKVLENNMSAAIRVSSRTDNVAGVKLPVFGQYETGVESNENLGLVGGGRKIQACRDKFGEYLKALVKLASLQTSFLAMDEALKVTNRRVNALENVTLPKIIATISYINRELDELEREDFTRLKMVKKKKEESIKNEALLKLEAAAAALELNNNLPDAPASNKINSQAASPPPVPSAAAPVENPFNSGSGATTPGKKNKKNAKGKKEAASSNLAGLDEVEDEDLIFK